VYNISYRRKH